MLELLGLTLTLQHIYSLLARFLCSLWAFCNHREENVNIAMASSSHLLGPQFLAHRPDLLLRPYDWESVQSLFQHFVPFKYMMMFLITPDVLCSCPGQPVGAFLRPAFRLSLSLGLGRSIRIVGRPLHIHSMLHTCMAALSHSLKQQSHCCHSRHAGWTGMLTRAPRTCRRALLRHASALVHAYS